MTVEKQERTQQEDINTATTWKNEDSIYYHKPGEFRDFIINIADRSTTVRDAMQRFRERGCLPKRLAELTVGKIRQDDKLIAELYTTLKNNMQPLSKLSLPFKTSKLERGQELIDNIVEYGFDIDSNKATYNLVKGHYRGDGLDYHYVFEIAAAPLQSPVDKLNEAIRHHDSEHGGGYFKFIGMVNMFPGIDYGQQYFEGSSDIYSWNDRKNGIEKTASSISGILQQCGYTINLPISRQKQPSVFIANLISPRIEWQGGYGKSRIANLHVFAHDIAKTVAGIANKMPTFHGWHLIQSRNRSNRPRKIEVLLKVLQARKREWESLDAKTRRKRWWTQSDVYYATRKSLLECGYEENQITGNTRNYLTSAIRDLCETILKVKREEIGIIAADRAQLYFKGQWTDVGLKEIEELSNCGTDMLVIEKEGVAEQLGPFADEMGIALLNTRGFPVEYAQILTKISAQKRCNIAILTDFDDSGLLMAARAPEIYRIGIDFQTLDDLGLSITDVEESYTPGKHFKSLNEFDAEYYGIYPDEILDYIEHKRIEINSVITELKDNGKFWEWILDKLRAKFHNRDGNRSIDVPQYVMPKILEDLNNEVERNGIAILKGQRKKLQKKLSHISPGFLFDKTNNVLKDKGEDIMTIPEYERLLVDQSRHIIESSEIMKPLLAQIQDVVQEALNVKR